MTVNISIAAQGGPEDVAEYLRHIASEVEAGETRGKASNGTSWEIDDYADETRTERVWLDEPQKAWLE
jgi:hypothetical protein